MFPSDLNYNLYKDILGKMESNNDYKKVNSIGALGKYQFMTNTLNNLKRIYDLPAWNYPDYFLDHPELQEQYENALILDSLTYIDNNHLNTYDGKIISGSIRFPYITTKLNVYGMLAAIHLSGSSSLNLFLKTGYDDNDGKTSLSDYAAYFSSKISNNMNFAFLGIAFLGLFLLYYI